MSALYEKITFFQYRIQNGKFTPIFFILSALCLLCQPAGAVQSDIYIFDPNQSRLVKTGGIAGVNETHSIVGQFLVSVDSDDGTISFDTVDANLIDENGSVSAQNLEDILNTTALSGTIVDESTIQFEGKTDDGIPGTMHSCKYFSAL